MVVTMPEQDTGDNKRWFFHPPHHYSIRQWVSHYLGGLYHRSDQHHIFLLSSGLAFTLFVCVVPMVLVIFAVLGGILERSTIQSEISAFIEKMIPYGTYAETVKQFVFDRIEEFTAYRRVAGYIGGFGLLFAASGLFSSMRTILNRIYDTRVTKHAVVGKLRDLGMIILVMAYFLISTTVLPLLEIVKDSASHVKLLRFLEMGPIERASFFIISFLIIYIAFYVLYLLIPYEKLGKRVVMVSAFWAALLWELAKQAFGYYITHVASLKAIYGTYVFLIIVGIWFYYSSIAFILGAEIGQLYRERKYPR